MIASHDSYTYQRPKNILMSLISIFWRCQKLDIKQQYDLGVRVFDVRIYRNKNDKWGTAHGIAKFKMSFNDISDICIYFKNNFPGSILRIYLEDNVKDTGKIDDAYKIKEIFLNEADEAFSRYNNMIWEIGTHHPWVAYYKNHKFHPTPKDYYCHLFNWDADKSFSYNIKNFDWSSWSIPLYAKKHNPTITKEMINDPDVMHVIDYIGIYPKQ